MPEQLPLLHPTTPDSGTTIINMRCSLRSEDEQRVLVVSGSPLHHYSAQDAVAEAYAMVLLVDHGHATQKEVAIAFGCSERTVRRHQERYSEGGMAALAKRSGWQAGRRRVPKGRKRTIARLKDAGVSNREIARRLCVSEKAIRKHIGPGVEPLPQPALPFPTPEPAQSDPLLAAADTAPSTPAKEPSEEAPSSTSEQASDPADKEKPPPKTMDTEPSDRTMDRLQACSGKLNDALPMFADADAVPRAGVLLAIPALVASGIFGVAGKLYGEIGPAFYGLRTTFLVMLLMALWRIQRPEALKEHDPQGLGRVLGLDRAPEVKTLRAKLTRLASYQKADELGMGLARLRVEHRGKLMGFLYVDGHVRAYHGKRTIPKTHLARMRISMPGTTDYWVNDISGDPLFVVTAKANAGMVTMLPQVLGKVRELVAKGRRITVVFDRGGWSPKLFARLIHDDFDILTYRKGKTTEISIDMFVVRQATFEGRQIEYRLHDQAVEFLGGKLKLRQVTRLCDGGTHQTPIITSRTDLTDVEVAWRMFERWRQENFFKYMRMEFLLDALSDYKVEEDDPTRTIPNPTRRAMDKQIAEVRARVAELEQAYGAAAVDNPEKIRPTMRGFKSAHGSIGKPLREARERYLDLLEQRRKLPVRVPVRDASQEAVIKLATERKHLTNLVKMVAYQAESDLLSLLQPHYARADQEGRTLIHEVLAAAADIHVEGDRLTVTLASLSSPHRTAAILAICQALNETDTVFPGSQLRLRYDVHPPPDSSLAFPGPRARPPEPAEPDNSQEG